jgi:hypothetical protein
MLSCILYNFWSKEKCVLNITIFLFQETLHNNKIHRKVEALEASSEVKDSLKEIETSLSKRSLLKNWPLMSSIIVYCIFSLHDMGYTEVI